MRTGDVEASLKSIAEMLAKTSKSVDTLAKIARRVTSQDRVDHAEREEARRQGQALIDLLTHNQTPAVEAATATHPEPLSQVKPRPTRVARLATRSSGAQRTAIRRSLG